MCDSCDVLGASETQWVDRHHVRLWVTQDTDVGGVGQSFFPSQWMKDQAFQTKHDAGRLGTSSTDI